MNKVLVFVVGVCALAAGSYTMYSQSVRSQKPEVLYWADRLREDPESARAEYQKEGHALSYDDSHSFAHIFGEALFSIYGVGGIQYCTEEFSYGCYHAVASEAFLLEGPDASPLLQKACARLAEPLACVHGVGHGILSYVGDESIARAFEMCAPLNAGVSDVGGCFGGIMMEYHFRTMSSPAGIDVRPLSLERPESVCPTLHRGYQGACYYELPAWWRATVPSASDMEYDWAPVGQMCARVPEYVQPYCFRGIGNVVAPQSGYYTQNIENACARMPSEEAARICIHEAFGHLLGFDAGRARLRSFCVQSPRDPFCVEHERELH